MNLEVDSKTSLLLVIHDCDLSAMF